MRASRREVNIFNTSLLDILCGALGAFCFLTLTLFPYYGKKESEVGVEKGIAERKLREAQGRLKALEMEMESAEGTRELRELERRVAEKREQAARLGVLEKERAAAETKLEQARARGKQRNAAMASAEADALRQRLRTLERLMQRPRTGTPDLAAAGASFLIVVVPHPEGGPKLEVLAQPPQQLPEGQISYSDGVVWLSYAAVPGAYRFGFRSQPQVLRAALGLHAYVCARAGCGYVGPERFMVDPAGPLRGFAVDLSANGSIRVR